MPTVTSRIPPSCLGQTKVRADTFMRTSDTTTLGTLPNATKPSVGMVQAQVVLPVLQVLQAQAVGGGEQGDRLKE
jgi:hypothetical protein